MLVEQARIRGTESSVTPSSRRWPANLAGPPSMAAAPSFRRPAQLIADASRLRPLRGSRRSSTGSSSLASTLTGGQRQSVAAVGIAQYCHKLRRVVWRRDHERSGTLRLRRMPEENRASPIPDRCVVVSQIGVPEAAGLRHKSATAEPSYGPLNDVFANGRRLEMGSQALLVDRPGPRNWTASLVTAYSRVLREAAMTRVVAGTLTANATAQPSTSKNTLTHAVGMTSATTRIAHDEMSDRPLGAVSASAITDTPRCAYPVIKAPNNRSVKRYR